MRVLSANMCIESLTVSSILSAQDPFDIVGMEAFTLDHYFIDAFRELDRCTFLEVGWKSGPLSSSSSTVDCWCVGTATHVVQQVADAKPVTYFDGVLCNMPILHKCILSFGQGHYLGWIQVYCGQDLVYDAMHAALNRIVPGYGEGPAAV